jgi:hypothetical protein
MAPQEEVQRYMASCPKCGLMHSVEIDINNLPPPGGPRPYLLRDLEDMLGVSRRTLHRYIRTHRLEAYKPDNDRRWHVSRKALERFRAGRQEA